MHAVRTLHVVALAVFITVLVGAPAPSPARSVGQVIDDATIAASVKTKLVADAVSNLTKVSVKVNDGVVTLSGDVDTPLRRDRAVQIAAAVDGVKTVVDDIRVTGVTPTTQAPPPPPVPSTSTAAPATGSTAATSAAPSVSVPGTVDVNGVVAQVDPRAKTITLRDGRVVKAGDGTVIWQPVPLTSVQPGAQVSLRNVEPAGYQSASPATRGDGWRMGTVSRVDTATNTIVLTDGTMVRVPPSAKIRINGADVAIASVQPGTEIVVRTPARTATIDASDIEVVATPR
jgi:hyperosmotically inducible protein